jgi:hypothetical protein
MTSLSAQDDARINGSATNGCGGSAGGVPCKFTWKELSKLNEPHNAHVAYRGRVSCTESHAHTVGETEYAAIVTDHSI